MDRNEKLKYFRANKSKQGYSRWITGESKPVNDPFEIKIKTSTRLLIYRYEHDISKEELAIKLVWDISHLNSLISEDIYPNSNDLKDMNEKLDILVFDILSSLDMMNLAKFSKYLMINFKMLTHEPKEPKRKQTIKENVHVMVYDKMKSSPESVIEGNLQLAGVPA